MNHQEALGKILADSMIAFTVEKFGITEKEARRAIVEEFDSPGVQGLIRVGLEYIASGKTPAEFVKEQA